MVYTKIPVELTSRMAWYPSYIKDATTASKLLWLSFQSVSHRPCLQKIIKVPDRQRHSSAGTEDSPVWPVPGEGFVAAAA